MTLVLFLDERSLSGEMIGSGRGGAISFAGSIFVAGRVGAAVGLETGFEAGFITGLAALPLLCLAVPLLVGLVEPVRAGFAGLAVGTGFVPTREADGAGFAGLAAGRLADALGRAGLAEGCGFPAVFGRAFAEADFFIGKHSRQGD